MNSIFYLLCLTVTWAAAEPPVPSYYHSSYDDMSAYEAPRQSHSSYPVHEDPNVEHEVVIQHHHYPSPTHASRVVEHGAPEYAAPAPVKKTRVRSRPQYHAVRASSYDAPKAEYAEPSPYETYPASPYKASDYKGYSVISTSVPSDDYGVEAYSPSHSSDYGSPNSYQNQPVAYKVASHSYSPPSSASYAASSGSYPSSSYEPHQGGYRFKGHRTPHNSYGTPVKTSYTTKTSSYGVPKGSSYGSSPKYVSVSSRPVYAPAKASYSSPKGSYPKPAYYRQSTKAYVPATTPYAAAAPSYAYGSPASKGFGYSYTQYDKPMEKGYVRFAAAPAPEDSYGGSDSYGGISSTTYLDQGEDDVYGGAYDTGSSPY